MRGITLSFTTNPTAHLRLHGLIANNAAVLEQDIKTSHLVFLPDSERPPVVDEHFLTSEDYTTLYGKMGLPVGPLNMVALQTAVKKSKKGSWNLKFFMHSTKAKENKLKIQAFELKQADAMRSRDRGLNISTAVEYFFLLGMKAYEERVANGGAGVNADKTIEGRKTGNVGQTKNKSANKPTRSRAKAGTHGGGTPAINKPAVGRIQDTIL